MSKVMATMQSGLAKEGFDPGLVDGKGGRNTAGALGDFMEQLGVTFDVNMTLTDVTLKGPRLLSAPMANSNIALTGLEEDELGPVHPDMAKVTLRAKETCPLPFGIFDGIRTAPEQNALFKRKASQKDGYRNISKHQKQADGHGHAVDLVPLINGNWDWDWDVIYVIADHMQMAAEQFNVQVRWGGCWQVINGLNGAPENWVAAYVKRKLSQNKRAFNDGPHFELYGY